MLRDRDSPTGYRAWRQRSPGPRRVYRDGGVGGALYGSIGWCYTVLPRPESACADGSLSSKGLRGTWKGLIHPDDLPVVEETARRHEAGETEVFEVEHRMRTRDGWFCPECAERLFPGFVEETETS
ncbi:MAG: PAS domain-containing protein [bacterium]|nr:PAS domain-containing protein [bacterium]